MAWRMLHTDAGALVASCAVSGGGEEPRAMPGTGASTLDLGAHTERGTNLLQNVGG